MYCEQLKPAVRRGIRAGSPLSPALHLPRPRPLHSVAANDAPRNEPQVAVKEVLAETVGGVIHLAAFAPDGKSLALATSKGLWPGQMERWGQRTPNSDAPASYRVHRHAAGFNCSPRSRLRSPLRLVEASSFQRTNLHWTTAKARQVQPGLDAPGWHECTRSSPERWPVQSRCDQIRRRLARIGGRCVGRV